MRACDRTVRRSHPFEELIERLHSGFLWACFERGLEMDAIPRATVLASQAFTAGIPFTLIVSAFALRGRDFASHLIHRFGLRGSTAEQVRALFNSPHDVRSGVTLLGVLFLVVAAMGLARSLQIIYERSFGFPHLGLRARWRAAAWLLGATVYIVVFVLLGPNIWAGSASVASAFAAILPSAAFWLWTPRMLVGPRVSLRRLLPTAALTTTAVMALVLVSPLYMPKTIRDNAARFGTIGVAFSLLSWLVVLAFLLVGCAVIASQLDAERADRERAGAARAHDSD
jgi:membrane protein